MARILDGKQVVAALNEKLRAEVEQLKGNGTIPTLAIVRLGERPDDISYERGAMKRAETIGVEVRQFVLPAETEQQELLELIQRINADEDISGLLLFRPLPKHIDEEKVRNAINPAKDVDGITDLSLAGVFTGSGQGYPPCTAQACLEMLDYYGIELKGKRVVMIGRSLVVGKPLAMMLLGRHATLTICHTRTINMPAICREAEIVIAAAGKAKVVDGAFFSPGQIVIDVGINVDEAGNLCGDADFAAAEQIVEAITPVPGGIGTVTTSVLYKQVIEAAKKQ
ncbi:MAG: bifunctional 5,10-methylenetetrahydrofolate dehydrogenase/5,10-methenyltetrahydrofolate cyclohydrolase [Firmicutes bacterium]|nr:bifunctional 5,10-methylenetetrahydrofolate dehydrogenase/5,10-methenyltetrahydrofolate cyclohydrolase [Bacillota bacterium]